MFISALIPKITTKELLAHSTSTLSQQHIAILQTPSQFCIDDHQQQIDLKYEVIVSNRDDL